MNTTLCLFYLYFSVFHVSVSFIQLFTGPYLPLFLSVPFSLSLTTHFHLFPLNPFLSFFPSSFSFLLRSSNIPIRPYIYKYDNNNIFIYFLICNCFWYFRRNDDYFTNDRSLRDFGNYDYVDGASTFSLAARTGRQGYY